MRPIMEFFFSKLSGPGFQIWAQQSLGPTPFVAATPATAPAGAGLMAVVVLVLLLLSVGIAVKLYDRSRKREEEAVALQARVSDVLMVEPSLSGLTPTVRLPLWRRGPVVIELSGSVPQPALRQAAITLVLREVGSMGKSCSLHDRIAVTPARLGRAA